MLHTAVGGIAGSLFAKNQNMKELEGKNGGKIQIREVGDPGIPGAGRKPNLFKKHIHELAEGYTSIVLDGLLVDEDGNTTSQKVRVEVKLPGAMGVVIKAYKKAAKGDAAARRWLTETGWGKTINLGNNEDSPLGGGFVLVLPDNTRDAR